MKSANPEQEQKPNGGENTTYVTKKSKKYRKSKKSSDSCFGVHIINTIIRDVHIFNCGHCGARFNLSELQEKFHVVSARQVPEFLCRMLHGKMCSQMMKWLPADRVMDNIEPFQHCGVDVFGHFTVTVMRKAVKR